MLDQRTFQTGARRPKKLNPQAPTKSKYPR
jgi:hypothetical protein